MRAGPASGCLCHRYLILWITIQVRSFLCRWMLKPGRVFRHMDNLRSAASRSSMSKMRRFRKTITVLLPELAERLERTGGTIHLELMRTCGCMTKFMPLNFSAQQRAGE